MESLQQLDPFLRSLWYIAIPVSLIFIVQTIMTFMGTDSHDGAGADFNSNLDGHDSPFQLFSLRNLVNFLLGLSWTAISLHGMMENKVLLMAVSVLVGCGFVVVFFMIMRQVNRFAEDNSFRVENTVNKTGSVYLSIPGHKGGKGKIQVSVHGAMHELEAITDTEKIETGSLVRIIRVEGGLPVVEKL